jgi:hypothetical protein
MNTLIFEVRYAFNYALNSGSQVGLQNDHVYWWALASGSEVPAEQCDSNGVPLPGRASSKKECWVTGLPECPAQYDRDHSNLPITCSGSHDNAGSSPIYPKHLVDSAHADYFFGWDPLRLDFLTHACLNSSPECKGPPVGFGMTPAGPNCSDGFDNDGDGKVDWQPDGTGDPDCTSPADMTETPARTGRTLYFAATPTHAKSGKLVRLSWSAENTPINTGCIGSGSANPLWNGAQFVNSNQEAMPASTYTITCDPCDYGGGHTTEVCPDDWRHDPTPGRLPPLSQTVTVTLDRGRH